MEIKYAVVKIKDFNNGIQQSKNSMQGLPTATHGTIADININVSGVESSYTYDAEKLGNEIGQGIKQYYIYR